MTLTETQLRALTALADTDGWVRYTAFDNTEVLDGLVRRSLAERRMTFPSHHYEARITLEGLAALALGEKA